MAGSHPVAENPPAVQVASPFGFVRALEWAAAERLPQMATYWEIILYIQENLAMANGAVRPLEALKNWGDDFDPFARRAYSWLLVHHESNSSESAIAGISHTRPRLRQQIMDSLASHERINRNTNVKGAVDQTFPDSIKSEVDFWSQEAITKSINNRTPAASAIADIPQTRQQQAVYIREMFDALKNTQDIIEKASNHKVGTVKSTSGRVFQDIAWVLYREARNLQQGKPGVKPWCTSFKYKQYPTMRARWNDMVEFFQTSKAAVANLIVAHSEKRFAGNPTKEKQRKTVNDKGNKKKATKMKDNEEKAARLDKVVKDAKGKAAAAKSAPDQGTNEEWDAEASEDLGGDGEAEETDYEAEEFDDSAREREDNDHESDDEATHLLQNAQQDVDRYDDIPEDQDSDDLKFQFGRAMGDSAASTVPLAGTSQPHAPAYPPLPGSISHRRQVRAIFPDEGHPPSIMPSNDHESYHPCYSGGLVSPNVQGQCIDDARSNDLGSSPLSGQPMDYLEHTLHRYISPSSPELTSGIGFMGQAQPQEGRGSDTAVGTSRIAHMPLNTGTSGVGGGAQNNSDPQDSTNSSRSRARRNRHSSEDGSKTRAEAPPRRRPRI
ncbi:hypothetical protein NEUTE1DRAFT_108214 [Neurospora tetrasperma FGSC 2508]|uniref:Uncharacterized protein n=1 Tax=Neurospora tetrasperma (strain FGSC 2508 / ATCC MYA-4615 / P0657) TaxID=510951 RepID=F8MGD5_NEUT8|nr:uncharacterized protein NEUTE1DRAFT_108214 [Neurospora tetrasperma FGSC 2508]EGO58610.1 hypothetical protein NEUTE1DRAFT_108214 [Neurospora tetrasperma FGSC 2508]EGZ72684.1 hypothetical protein NEUTE2DRAFT_62786 [Neurospora tetrasperma FGSC 2509]